MALSRRIIEATSDWTVLSIGMYVRSFDAIKDTTKKGRGGEVELSFAAILLQLNVVSSISCSGWANGPFQTHILPITNSNMR
ncbi:hypothetical protein Leryth_018521 [Lithospermum erythrorhizon]|nr:hypothetical protein Leryth_018521 [Lithospermum erythrorhizon]